MTPGYGGAGASLWDTHCHLGDPSFAADRADVLARARAVGIGSIVVVGASPDEWGLAVDATAGDSPVRLALAFGFHPYVADQADGPQWAALTQRLTCTPGVVAVGEIGLDHHGEAAPRAVQHDAFVRQLQLADRLRLPVILHERQAAAEVIQVLRTEGVPRAGGVWHCFSGDVAVAREALGLGLHLGFGGLVTFARGTEAVRAAARFCPRDRLLLETDAPYLSPVPYRGRRNEPARVAEVLAFLAGLRGESADVLGAATTAAAGALFGAGAG